MQIAFKFIILLRQFKPWREFFITILISILIIGFVRTSAALYNDSTQYFVPCPDTEKLAQKLDRKYFPLFIQALNEIETNQFELVAEYLNKEFKTETDLKSIPPFEETEAVMNPVYWNTIERKAYVIPLPIQWNNPEHTDPSWNMWFKSLRWLNSYLSSNEVDSIFLAFKVINDFILSHTEYPDELSRFSYHDHASAERLLVFIKAFEVYQEQGIYQFLFERRLLTSILGHIFFLGTLEKYDSWNNHGIITDQYLLRALTLTPYFYFDQELYDLATSRVYQQLLYGFTIEGIHKQHSPCYHFITKRRLDDIISLIKSLNKELPQNVKSMINEVNDYQKYIINDRFPLPIGDCSRGITNRILTDSFCQGLKVFPLSGWAFLRDSLLDINIIAQSNFHSFAHYQEQETSFVLNAGGNELIIDPGLLTYNRSSPYYEYMRSASGHNVLLVDGRNFNSELNNTGLSGITRYFQDSSGVNSSNGIVELTHLHYLDMGVEIHRQLAFAGNNISIVKDIIKSDSVRNYSQQFHLAPGATITRNRKSLYVHWNEHPYYLKISGNIKNYEVVEGQMDPVQGWYFPAFNQAEPCPVLILNDRGSNKTLTTRIEVYKDGINEKDLKVNRKEIGNLFSSLKKIERRQLVHEPFPPRWRPKR